MVTERSNSRLRPPAPSEVHSEKENHTQDRVLYFSHILGVNQLNLGYGTVGRRNAKTL